MTEKMKDWQIYKCPYCSCEYYDRTARKGRKVGDPMIECPNCQKKSYRESILEPALIGGKRFFDIRFSSAYGNIRIGLILIYAVFLFFILVKRDFVMAMCFIAAAVVLYCLYEIIRVCHRKSYLASEEYHTEIAYSLKRLADQSYAKMVISAQGMDKDSVYYYELNESKK